MPDVLPYSYRVLKFDLTAGLTDLEIPIHAERIDYVSPTDGPELQIRLQLKGNDQLPLRPNGSIEAPFTRFYLSASATAKTVFLMVGAPAGVRVTGRDVAISGLISGRSLLEHAANLGQLYERGQRYNPDAANFTHLQVWNPPSSGKNVWLLKYISTTDAAALVLMNLNEYNTQLTGLTGNFFNATLGGPASTAELRFQANGIQFGGTAVHHAFFIPANGGEKQVLCAVPIGPGKGVVLVPNAINQGHVATFFIWEF